MKRWFVVVLITVLAAVLVLGCAKGYESPKKAGDLNVTLAIKPYPLVQADNTMNFKITDSAGKAITDADVHVRYYMPPMPGMAPMDYVTKASQKGNVYSITADIPMAGGWKVETSVKRPGKETVIAKFNLDAR